MSELLVVSQVPSTCRAWPLGMPALTKSVTDACFSADASVKTSPRQTYSIAIDFFFGKYD